jgi:murein DD-endopeptidase MepM/ murein hydrolase activator NlpD
MRIVSILLIAAAIVIAGWLWTRFEGSPPLIETLSGPVVIGSAYTHDIWISDEGSGVERVRVWIDTPEGEKTLLEEVYTGSPFRGADLDLEQKLSVEIRPSELGLSDGLSSLRVEVRDFSLRGNVSRADVALDVDTRPPRVSLFTGLTYVRRGGAEAAIYQVHEAVKGDGIQIGETLFPGFPHPERPELRIAFYALVPGDGSGENGGAPAIVAVDRAGNETKVPLTISVVQREFPTDSIELSDSFLARTVAELGGSDEDLIGRYLEINREMRAESDAKIRDICGRSSEDRLWRGRFLQLPNSKVGAGFGDRRTYFYGGKPVDAQVHFGYDLASTSRAPVPAANHGVVVFAEPLGIYGNSVVLDHGLGLFSLYGHLSEIGVEVGNAIAKEEILGRTGQTGLAGGDHLHFAMIVNGEFVDPLEWFDPKWIEDHIEPKLVSEAEEQVPANPAP